MPGHYHPGNMEMTEIIYTFHRSVYGAPAVEHLLHTWNEVKCVISIKADRFQV